MIKIYLSNRAGKELYSGLHKDLRQALEFCIQSDICLDGVNLDHTNLRHANLDGWNVRNASFIRTDLRGANMSEATFINCDFSRSMMQDTCLCYSDLLSCSFFKTKFKKTDISEARIDNPVFSHDAQNSLAFSQAYRITNRTILPPDMTEKPYTHPQIALVDPKKAEVLLNYIEESEVIYLLKHLISLNNHEEERCPLHEPPPLSQRNNG